MASMDEEMMGAEETVISDLSNPAVTDKYRAAAKIVNFTLNAVLTSGLLVPGTNVVDICEFSDKLIEGQAALAYKAQKVDKGVAFPTCVSVNECVGNFSPLKAESIVLKAGDLVKIDLGAHIDGFIAVAAHTVVVADPSAPVTAERTNVLLAAYQAAEIALRTIKPGNTNTQVTEAIARVAEAYGVKPVSGVLMHQMKQYIIDGSKVVLLRGDEPEHKVEEFTFEANEVYSIDVIMSTGEGKPREHEARTTVFKRAPETTYNLKMKASRFVVNEVLKKFTYMPFTIRALGDEAQARMGVVECVKHGVLHPYPVMFEREGAELAHFKFTALLLPGGTLKVAGLNVPGTLASDKSLPEDLKALLATEPYAKGGKKSA